MHKDEFQLQFFMCVIQSRRVVRTDQSTGTINYAALARDELSLSFLYNYRPKGSTITISIPCLKNICHCGISLDVTLAPGK